MLKVHPSNYHVSGFTSAVPVAELAELDAPLVVDIGSGLLTPHPLLPDEPDATTVLRDGADLVTASGDKLLGGPQAGLLFGDGRAGRAAAPASGGPRAARRQAHPRRAGGHAGRSAVAGGPGARRRRDRACAARAERLAAQLPEAQAVDCIAAVGGGGAPGVELPSAAVSLPESYAAPLRTGTPPVVGRVEGGRCLLDLRTVAPGATTRRLVRGGAGMYVIATAGHVDHGKSTLVQRLTGMWPDRLAEEQRRGLTIDLGFAWTEIDGRQFAFVDVPGHERFVANMLAGVGPVPAVMFVVAATEGWMPQSEEHLAALHALGVRHVLVVISKADLADPGPADRAGARADAGCAGRARYRPESGSRRIGFTGRRTAAAGPRRRRAAVGGPLVHRPRGGHRRHRHAGRGHHPRRRRTRACRAARHGPRSAVAGPGPDERWTRWRASR